MARLGRNKLISEGDLKALHGDVSQWALYCVDFDHDLAKDTMQQSYLKVVEGSALYAGKSTLKTWLFGVVRLTALELKKQQRRARLPRDGDVDELRVEDAMSMPSDHQAMEAALRQLSLMQREIAYLVFYRDLSLSEIAAVLGVSTGTVSKQYHRAKVRLAKLLAIGEEENPSGSLAEKAFT